MNQNISLYYLRIRGKNDILLLSCILNIRLFKMHSNFIKCITNLIDQQAFRRDIVVSYLTRYTIEPTPGKIGGKLSSLNIEAT